MVAIAPHYLLLTETHSFDEAPARSGSWRFSLTQINGSDYLEAADTEPGLHGERLQLLAVIRGLEAIGQPSRVTLVTSSRYVSRGIRRDLSNWREMHWTWERFGELHPINHAGLWQRLDRALQYHSVRCRSLRLAAGQAEPMADSVSGAEAASGQGPAAVSDRRPRLWGGWFQRLRRFRFGERLTSLEPHAACPAARLA